jgi:hypothetical protein
VLGFFSCTGDRNSTFARFLVTVGDPKCEINRMSGKKEGIPKREDIWGNG